MPSKQWLEKHADAADWLTVSDELVLTKNEALLVAALRDLLDELSWRPMETAPRSGRVLLRLDRGVTIGHAEIDRDTEELVWRSDSGVFVEPRGWLPLPGVEVRDGEA